ncbi:MAG: hypothetical protein ABI690_06365 [Chloroflexota bacterium]
MGEIFRIAWERFKIITALIADAEGRFVAMLFYFTFFAPFALGARLFNDPLQQRNKNPVWLDRPPVPSDIDSAKRQG